LETWSCVLLLLGLAAHATHSASTVPDSGRSPPASRIGAP
jgi:hypothetical protein